MSPINQRGAIAEACGWVRVIETRGPLWQGERNDGSVNLIPDYLNDLNACHEAEKTLMADKWNVYVNALDSLVEAEGQPARDFQWCTATAAQRCEAFLKTIGKWEDSP